ncbi:prolipoprotein diacylglyceryl transferase [Microbacterium terricola]|uniref:Diacylglyceryl transferase n=1 Tax=Microbacterium terricola TaxID=344163 RepID=A0ABM8E1S0_9MICO|nr:prolipoprotein diacylglyceryl transferase [Microbacterium terricola]UYK40399.1 prolipoprotein diacylglyceryl transferase [Microbacterium terricola]BDV31883.1 diacylglyceryl transferase [Microbacterium terricola]
MFPTLQDLAPWLPPLGTHSVFVALGLAAAGIVFLIERRRRGVTDPRIPYIVLGALAGAALLSRLGTWAQHLDPSKNLSLIDQLAYGNASMLSALVGAWLGVHVAKRIVRYKPRTGDLFAPAVALAMVIGRVGCYLTEAPGGVPLNASFLVEILFHAIAFALLWFWLRHRDIAAGETLTLYIAAYGIFRFCIEFVRGNDVAWMGLTRPQLFLLITIPILLARIAWMGAHGRFTEHSPAPVERTAPHEQHA